MPENGDEASDSEDAGGEAERRPKTAELSEFSDAFTAMEALNSIDFSETFEAMEAVNSMDFSETFEAMEAVNSMDFSETFEAMEAVNSMDFSGVYPAIHAANSIDHSGMFEAMKAVNSLDYSGVFSAMHAMDSLEESGLLSSMNAVEGIEKAIWASSLEIPEATATGNSASMSQSTYSTSEIEESFGQHGTTASEIEDYLNEVRTQVAFNRTYQALQIYGDRIDRNTLLFIAFQFLNTLPTFVAGPGGKAATVMGSILGIIVFERSRD